VENKLMRLEIIRCLTKAFGVVLEAAEAVVAIVAEKAANLVRSVAVVNGERIALSLSRLRLGKTADRTNSVLRGAHGRILLRRNVVPRQRNAPHNLLKRFAGFFVTVGWSTFFGQLSNFRYRERAAKIFDSAISVVTVNELNVPWHWLITKHDPYHFGYRHSLLSNADVSRKIFGASSRGVPVPSNVANAYSRVSGWLFPSKRKWLSGVIRKKGGSHFASYFHARHPNIVCGGAQ
jgi:hypothetical protein